MPLSSQVQRSTLIRKLPYTALTVLAKLLDPPSSVRMDWKGLASRIPSKFGQEKLKYTQPDIMMFELEYRRPGGSPTIAILRDWGTLNTVVEDLVSILVDMGRYDAVTVLFPDYTPEFDVKNTSTMNIPNSYMPHPHKKDEDDMGGSSFGGYHNEVQAEPKLAEQDESLDFTAESFLLPTFEPDKIKEFNYLSLSKMTDNFNDMLFGEGGRLVGEGGFGRVYLGIFSDGHECAVKKLKKDDSVGDVDVEKQFRDEVQTLQRLKHPNLVQLYGSSFDGPCPCLVFHFLRNGSLQSALCPDSALDLPWTSRVHVALGTAQGLCFLHKNGGVHRDVKSANVLLDKDLTAKVADFGLVRTLPKATNQTQITTTIIGSKAYMPPEAFYGAISPRGDCYSYGVVLLELITGAKPLDNSREYIDIITHVEVEMDAADGNIVELVDPRLRSEYKEAGVREMYDIASLCLLKKNKRPLLSDLLPRLIDLGKMTASYK